MDTGSKEKANKKTLIEDLKKRDMNVRSIARTVRVSIEGIICYANEGKSIILYLLSAIIEIILGFLFHVNGLEWILIISILGVILAVELLNTGIERACDAITLEYNEMIKHAKDCGSAATFVIFIVAVILNIIIFAPKIALLF